MLPLVTCQLRSLLNLSLSSFSQSCNAKRYKLREENSPEVEFLLLTNGWQVNQNDGNSFLCQTSSEIRRNHVVDMYNFIKDHFILTNLKFMKHKASFGLRVRLIIWHQQT